MFKPSKGYGLPFHWKGQEWVWDVAADRYVKKEEVLTNHNPGEELVMNYHEWGRDYSKPGKTSVCLQCGETWEESLHSEPYPCKGKPMHQDANDVPRGSNWQPNVSSNPKDNQKYAEITGDARPRTSTNPKDKIGRTKPPLHLIPAGAVIEEAVVMGLGAAKYGPYNWRDHSVSATVYIAAAQRHILSWLDKEDTDPESGASHLAHARACLGILLDAKATGNLLDDRPKPGAAAALIRDHTTETPR